MIEKLFNAACGHIKEIGSGLTDQDQLVFYGLFKQSRVGNCNPKDKPSALSFVASRKWQSWEKLIDVSQKEAKCAYILEVGAKDPKFQDKIWEVLKIAEEDSEFEESDLEEMMYEGVAGGLRGGKSVSQMKKDNTEDLKYIQSLTLE